jgi:hypothetical protein
VSLAVDVRSWPTSDRHCHAVSMQPDPEREPLLVDHFAVLRFDDFCLSTGLDRVTGESLFRTELLECTFWTRHEPSRPASILIDKLPSRESLVAWGLTVRDDYPANLRRGGIECQTHGWAQSVLVARHDADGRKVPDHSMCWECSQAGVPPDSGNSTPLGHERVESWRRTHDRDGNWIGSEEDALPGRRNGRAHWLHERGPHPHRHGYA